MDYFFRCQKSTFNLENNKCICQGNCFVYHVSGSTFSGIIFRVMCISSMYTKLRKKLGKFSLHQNQQFCKICKFLNFMEVLTKKKNLNYRSLNTLMQCILLILPFTVFEEQNLPQRLSKLLEKVIF